MQIAVQLKRFAAAAKKIKSAFEPDPSPKRGGASGASGFSQTSQFGQVPSAADLSSLFDTEKTGLDTSIAGKQCNSHKKDDYCRCSSLHCSWRLRRVLLESKMH